MKKKYIIYFLVIVVLGSFIAMRVSSRNKSKGTAVKTSAAVKGDIKAYLSTTGTIKSKNSKSYYGLQGKVKKVNVSLGDKVTKGQVLVTYETTDLSTAVKQAELQYSNAVLSRQDRLNSHNNAKDKVAEIDKQIAQNPALSQSLQDARKIYSQQILSDETIKQLNNQVALAKLQLDNAKQNAAKSVDSITADFDGVITLLSAVEGAATTGAQPVVTLQDTDNLKLAVSIGKYDANKIKLGQEAVVKSGNNQYKGKVSFINPAAQKSVSASGTDTTLGIEIDILDKAADLKIDFDTDVDVLLGTVSNALKVPAEAIKSDKTGKNYVYIVNGNKASEKVVKLGLQSDMEVEIIEGIMEGDKVILNPGVTIKEGALIKDSVEAGK